MIDPRHAAKKFPSYARKVRLARLAVASRRLASRSILIEPRRGSRSSKIPGLFAIMSEKNERVPTRSAGIIREM